jgi:luciferase family oxidoreductase group 1
VLESLFPGRIDMGLGRSVGFTGAVRRALGAEKAAADRFGEQLAELLGYFDPALANDGVRAVPARGLRVPAFVLALGAGAEVAAANGLPLVLAHLPDDDRMLAAIDRYRTAFAPAAPGDRPYLIVAVNAAVGATREAAALLQAPEAWASAVSRTRGVFPPLEPPDEVAGRPMTGRERAAYDRARASHVYGTEDEMAATLARLIARTGADELLITLATHGHAGRLASYRRLARLAGLGFAAAPAAPSAAAR